MSAVVTPPFRLHEPAADPISIPEPPFAWTRRGYFLEPVPDQPTIWSITRAGRFIGWLRRAPDMEAAQ